MQLRADEKSWAMWCHLSAFCAMVGIPFGSVVGPLIVWQIKKNESAFVDEHGREAVNFHLSLCLYAIAAVGALLLFGLALAGGVAASQNQPGFLLPFITIGGMIGPILFLAIFPILGIILTLIAGLKANNGEQYRYPFTIRFIK